MAANFSETEIDPLGRRQLLAVVDGVCPATHSREIRYAGSFFLFLLAGLPGTLWSLVAALFFTYKNKRTCKYGYDYAGGQNDCPVHFLLYLMIVVCEKAHSSGEEQVEKYRKKCSGSDEGMKGEYDRGGGKGWLDGGRITYVIPCLYP